MSDNDEHRDYLSNACFHDMHDYCRHCPFCDAACRCGCHAADATPDEEPVAATGLFIEMGGRKC